MRTVLRAMGSANLIGPRLAQFVPSGSRGDRRGSVRVVAGEAHGRGQRLTITSRRRNSEERRFVPEARSRHLRTILKEARQA